MGLVSARLIYLDIWRIYDVLGIEEIFHSHTMPRSGKSTLLHSLGGSIPLLKGDRKENPSLRLGVFTQDLAQELDLNSRAVDLVVAYARDGKGGDINLADQEGKPTT
jgi:hypothetical protein